MKRTCVSVIVTAFLSLSAYAAPNPIQEFKDRWDFNKACDARCTKDLFTYLAKIYRPTGDETGAREFVIAVVEESRKHWPADAAPGLTYTVEEKSGNLLVQVPGTGCRKNGKTVALQGHLDMVLAAREAKPGEDLKKYFENGVALEEKDGWLQSQDLKTSLGADNGIGMAMALRYVVDSRLAHPPLELVFTTSEEVGLKGASLFSLPLKATVMINVDGMIAVEGPPGIVYGSVGSNRTLVSGRFDAETVPVGAQIIQAEVLNLRGGHSGADIHLPRLNSVKAFAKLGEHILRTYPGSRIQGVISNSESGLNKIPSSFGATFAVVSAEPAAQISEDLSRFLRELVKSFADEDLTKVQITVQARAVSGKVLNAAASQQVVAALLATPSGLTHQDPKFPNGMRTSSNLGFVSLAPVAETSLLELRAAFMARSYVEPEMDQVVEQSTRALSAAWSGTANPPTTTKLAGYGPWLADQDSWLIRAVLSKVPYFQATYLLSVGLEPSYFKKNYPGLEIISIAPEIRDAHSASERVRIQSVYEITDALDQILQAL